MKYYEMLCILPGTLAEDEVSPVIERIKSAVESGGGTELVCYNKGKSRLSYPMKHIRYGYFNLLYFQSEAENIKEMQKKIRMIEGVLRIVVRSTEEDVGKEEKEFAFGIDHRVDSSSREGWEESKSKRTTTFEKKAAEPVAKEVVSEETAEDKAVVSEKKEEEQAEEAPTQDRQEAEEAKTTADETDVVDEKSSVESSLETKKVIVKPKRKDSKKKVSMEDIDKQLDEILQGDIDVV